ncbi:transmembrane protein 201 [Microcaecilia unicolor]|uniref:Transmembrane protein 201 n=1 Tax=Microcaecilia unicolor TaxID=1415580 RepID=A0A6P7WTN1_9AMPH|nr:transmembrane protein 201 [Microcaecilia unicolor]
MEGVSALLLPTAAGLTATAGGLLFYRLARRKPTYLRVNCWFCNQDTVVPYGNRNCWDCPNCEQYNGFQENGDYNKPIPAQYMEHLNHVASGGTSFCNITKPQQWVNSQILLCKKCNNNQSTKVKQLASFLPREEARYEEEIELYKHHLEQTYKLCRPCQAAVEYYIKHQNRQLRALLLSHQLKRRETDKSYSQSFCSPTLTTPARVILLRILAFLSCAVLVAMMLSGSGNPLSAFLMPFSLSSILSVNNSETKTVNTDSDALSMSCWQNLLHLLPEEVANNLRTAWTYGQNHQMGVICLGLLACLLAMLLAGRVRLRRIDAFASGLWVLVMGLHLTERYLRTDVPAWMDTVKFSATSLCCLVGFTAAIATRKSLSQQRYRPRRYLSGDLSPFQNATGNGIALSTLPQTFVPTPPNILQLTNLQFYRSPRRVSPSSLPGRLSRALSLGTSPSLVRTDSGYLFSGSRPPSRASQYKSSHSSDYFSLLSGSCAASPIPSPAPSVTGSVTSSSNSLRYRRPLICPARLNLQGRKLQLFPSQNDMLPTPSSSEETCSPDSVCSVELPPFLVKNRANMRSCTNEESIYSEASIHKENNSSHSSTCQVDTTTKGYLDDSAGWHVFKGYCGHKFLWGLLAVSLAVNVLFTSAYLYQR